LVHRYSRYQIYKKATFEINNANFLQIYDLLTSSLVDERSSEIDNYICHEEEVNESIYHHKDPKIKKLKLKETYSRLESNLEWEYENVPGGKTHDKQVPIHLSFLRGPTEESLSLYSGFY